MTMFLLFMVGVIGWCAIRSQLTLVEWQRRLVWVVCIALVAIPSFIGLQDNPAVTGVVWPFVAGIMAGELAWNRYKPKWDAFKLKTAAPPPKKKRRKKKPAEQPPKI